MRKAIGRSLMAGALVIGALGWASPAMAACETLGRYGPYTIGVGGEPIATTPWVAIGWCGSQDLPGTGTVPTLRVEKVGGPSVGELADYAIYADFGDDSAGVDWVFAVNVNGQSFEIPVSRSVGGGGGGSVCLFYHGVSFGNPGGCLVFLNR